MCLIHELVAAKKEGSYEPRKVITLTYWVFGHNVCSRLRCSCIRAVVLSEMTENLQAKVSKFEVEGNQVTYYYEVYIGEYKVDQGVAVAIIENGKIRSDLPVK